MDNVNCYASLGTVGGTNSTPCKVQKLGTTYSVLISKSSSGPSAPVDINDYSYFKTTTLSGCDCYYDEYDSDNGYGSFNIISAWEKQMEDYAKYEAYEDEGGEVLIDGDEPDTWWDRQYDSHGLEWGFLLHYDSSGNIVDIELYPYCSSNYYSIADWGDYMKVSIPAWGFVEWFAVTGESIEDTYFAPIESSEVYTNKYKKSGIFSQSSFTVTVDWYC